MKAEPQKEHQWLEKLLGEWTYEFEAEEPGKPPQKLTGTETVRSLGGLWVICEAQGDGLAGNTSATIMTLGYDPAKKKYVGTFLGGMMTHLWLYEGDVEGNGKVLTLDSEGPSFTAEGQMAQYKDSIEFLSDDHRTLSSKVQGDDGSWQPFMTMHYHRKK